MRALRVRHSDTSRRTDHAANTTRHFAFFICRSERQPSGGLGYRRRADDAAAAIDDSRAGAIQHLFGEGGWSDPALQSGEWVTPNWRAVPALHLAMRASGSSSRRSLASSTSMFRGLPPIRGATDCPPRTSMCSSLKTIRLTSHRWHRWWRVSAARSNPCSPLITAAAACRIGCSARRSGRARPGSIVRRSRGISSRAGFRQPSTSTRV